jgi:hypothetical protein
MVDAAYLPVVASGVGALISLTSFYFSRRQWREANRPSVLPSIETADCTDNLIAYNLAIENVGNRAALAVRVSVEETSFKQALHDAATPSRVEQLRKLFDARSEQPTLKPGGRVASAFGLTGNDRPTWKPGARLAVTVHYSDVLGKKYREQYSLIIKDSATFSGQMWKVNRTNG